MRINHQPSPYSEDQIASYLHKIRYFSDLTITPVTTTVENIHPTLENLTRIVQCHLLAFPFENLSMHYSADRKVDVTPQGVFDRAVTTSKGFGSYCFGLNTLLKGILLGLNYRVYAVGARIDYALPRGSDDGFDWGPIVHLVLIVQIPNPASLLPQSQFDEQLYLVDTGYGSRGGLSGLVRPIPLIDGTTVPGSAPPEQHRIISSRHPSSVIESFEHTFPVDWMVQARRNVKDKWRTLYHFNLHFEFFEPDIAFHSFAVSTMTIGILRHKVVVVKAFEIKDGDGEGNFGRIILDGNKIIRTCGEKREESVAFETENERVKALRENFGIMLDEDDASHIHGLDTALPIVSGT